MGSKIVKLPLRVTFLYGCSCDQLFHRPPMPLRPLFFAWVYIEYRKHPAAERRILRKRLLIALAHGTLNLIKFAILLVAGLFIAVSWLALKENPAPRRR